MATFEHPNSEFWGFQEGIQERVDYEGVLVSILERFSKAGNVKNEGFVWEGRIFLRCRALQDEIRFGSSFGGGLGEVFWRLFEGFEVPSGGLEGM